MYIDWIGEHVTAVADALFVRMKREGFPRRYQMIYCPGTPNNRGGIAVIPTDDSMPDGWLPVGGVMEKAYSMTRYQIRLALETATQRLPILDPDES